VPTYEYECGSCHRKFEVKQRISEPSLTTCDECGGPVHRLLSATPFILKGGGWYVTDYPSESRKKALDAEKSSSASSDKSDKASDKSSKSDKSDRADKPDKADKPAAASKTDGAGPASTSGASAAAPGPKSTD
jgi:putative FmdB family regulatory protein